MIFVGTFLYLLLANAPNVPHTAPFASLSIRTQNSTSIYLPNRIFTCKESEQQFQCQTRIHDRLLALSLTKGIEYAYNLGDCGALYDGKSVKCQQLGQTYAPILSTLYELADLELAPQQLQTIQQEYWGINTLMQWGEWGLTWISTAIALITGISMACLTWFYPGNLSKGFVSFLCGFGMYHFAWSLLGRISYDVVIPYGFTPETWGWMVNGITIVLGIGTMIATAMLLWYRMNRWTRTIISLSSGIGIFNLCSLSLLWVLNFFFGLSRLLAQNEYAVFLLSTAIAGILAIVSAIFLWLRNHQSIQKFVCLGSGIGTIALGTHFFMFLLLTLGYAD
jgi:hypothetical protein